MRSTFCLKGNQKSFLFNLFLDGEKAGSKVSPDTAHQENKCKNISSHKMIALQQKSGHYFQDGWYKKEIIARKKLKKTLTRMVKNYLSS